MSIFLICLKSSHSPDGSPKSEQLSFQACHKTQYLILPSPCLTTWSWMNPKPAPHPQPYENNRLSGDSHYVTVEDKRSQEARTVRVEQNKLASIWFLKHPCLPLIAVVSFMALPKHPHWPTCQIHASSTHFRSTPYSCHTTHYA